MRRNQTNQTQIFLFKIFDELEIPKGKLNDNIFCTASIS